jgi:hypothetical protein
VKLDDVRDVRKTTAKQVRRVLFGKSGDSAGDNEVVLAVRACVFGMPPMPVPVPSSSAKAYAAMHAYDASAAGLAVAVDVLGWKGLRLPTAALVEIEKYRIASERERAEKRIRKATEAPLELHGVTEPLAKGKRIVSRGTRRRKSEAAKLAARRA